MTKSPPLPWPGVALAVAGTIGMLVLGIRWDVSLAVLLLWLGSLWLIGARPPEVERRAAPSPFTRDSMGNLIELAGTPFLLTEKGKVVAANREARSLLGSHIVGQDLRVAFRQPDAIEFLQSKGTGGTIVRGLTRRRDIWRITRQQLDDGLALIELINKTAEADISRAHTDFVANASHELRTPLSSIIGYAETLREDVDDLDAANAGKFLDTILHEAKRLQNLVSDLMSLSRVEAEKHDLPETKIDLKRLVERAAREGAGANRAARLNLSLDNEFTIRGDAQQLEQLVRNLVDNALKYGAEDGTVTVSLEQVENGDARLRVTDTGPGIAPEHIPHLTRRFYRTDPGRSRATGGTGLGLAIVKHIVERHRGRLDITSKLGQGTTVSIRIPAVVEEEEALS